MARPIAGKSEIRQSTLSTLAPGHRMQTLSIE